MQDQHQAALADAYSQQIKRQLIREIVAASFEAEIASQRSQHPLRRRYLDETMVTVSPIAIAAGLA